jgi:long-chain fatty acid transport protein
MERKVITIMITSAALLAGSLSYGWAKGIFVTPGARANALGGAYTAIADDASAIYWNPAGLTQITGNSVETSAFYVVAPVTGNQSLRNVPAGQVANSADGDFPFPKIYPTEPGFYDSKDFNTSAVIPFLGGAFHAKNIAIGAGYYGAGGGGGIFENKILAGAGSDTIASKLAGMYGFSIANVSAAKEFIPGLSFGVGIDFIGYFESQEARKDYTANGSGYSFYTFDLQQNGTGSGVQVNGGLLYKVRPNLRAGLVYRSGATIKITGQSIYRQGGLSGFGIPDAALQSDYEKKYHYPSTYGLALAYEPVEKLTLAAGLDQARYSPTKNDIAYKNPVPGLFVNNTSDAKLKDVTQFRLGAEYRYTDTLTFRGGIQNDPVDTPTDTLTLTNTDQFDFLYYSAGVGYRIGSLTLDLSVLRGNSNKPSTADGRSYDYSHNEYRIAGNYRF